VVEDESSKLDYRYEILVTIDANHREMCRFPENYDAGYRRVENAIQHYVDRINVASRVAESISQLELPFPRDPMFVGRDTELDELETSMFSPETTSDFLECAIVGLGGVGYVSSKTLTLPCI
jgi:hypothetical protein